MSRIIIEDTGRSWEIRYNAQLKWMGQINGQKDLELVGPVDTLHADGVLIYTGDPATGIHYNSVTNMVTRFPAYDSFETAEAVFHFACYTFLMIMVITVIARFLTNKNPSI